MGPHRDGGTPSAGGGGRSHGAVTRGEGGWEEAGGGGWRREQLCTSALTSTCRGIVFGDSGATTVVTKDEAAGFGWIRGRRGGGVKMREG